MRNLIVIFLISTRVFVFCDDYVKPEPLYPSITPISEDFEKFVEEKKHLPILR
jgi:hypothetical protein